MTLLLRRLNISNLTRGSILKVKISTSRSIHLNSRPLLTLKAPQLSFKVNPLTNWPYYNKRTYSSSALNDVPATSAKTVNKKKPPPKKVLFELKRIFELAKPESKVLFLALALILISSGVSMLIPSVIGKLLDVAQKNVTIKEGAVGENIVTVEKNEKELEDDKDDTILFGLTSVQFYSCLGLIFVSGAIANVSRIILLKVTGEKIVARLRTRLLKSVLSQDATFWDKNRTGDIISRLSADCSIVSKTITTNISDGCRAVLQGAVGVGMMGYISWHLTCVMLLLIPPIGVMAGIYGRRVKNLSRDLQKQIGDLTKASEEQLSAVKTIQSYGAERLEIHRYAGEVRKVFNVGFKEALTSGGFFGATGLMGNIALIALLVSGTSMISSGSLSVGDLSSFMMYAVYTGSSLFGLSNFYSELMKGAGAATRVFELYDKQPLIHPTLGKIEFAKTFGSKTPIIKFENVSFKYPTRPDVNIFNHLNLTIYPGEQICIVGPSGGGKSTIMSLLLRLYDVDKGQVMIGDYDIRAFNLRKYRRMLGVVQQEPMLFNGTILDNILYGLPKRDEYTKEQIMEALQKANCEKFLIGFPDGLYTQVGPRGTQLSGGQKQRIALARAFLMDSDILLLDEATSALDTQSEQVVAKSLLERAERGKTTVSIAHRRSTIENSTRVIVLNKEGGVAESGTFLELISDPESDLNALLASKGV
ncbi:ATP-binding cassette permease MDL1 SCDLUD_003874 [Saccharomycodes ludwigii]|uniref:ATP-binding cassette permease MDL1 n=1 Tax=Saccharomycodes ludwigii TaxID=36035 RepID=UPI001E8325D4|nr:hypothetical protein SCDLUD_003874 [Saccharomycodes ludwigii]KAH3899594.1 hypothetical protein SCDLUD_003874 [Saccharomycodes ludwigii]